MRECTYLICNQRRDLLIPCSGTGWYDQALSETMLESLDFEYSETPNDNNWRCILGGAQQLAINMARSLTSNQPQFGQRVTAISAAPYDKLAMRIDVHHKPIDKIYNGVFNSTTLGCLGRIDTSGASLDYATHEAIRTVSYGPSAKVGVLFSRAWWMFDLGETTTTNYNIATGDLGHSDLNVRTVVYPSYNADLLKNKDKEAVLLVSYTWQQDALRMGSLMSALPGQEDANGLRKLLVHELARLHTRPDGPNQQQLEEIIDGSWRTHFSHDWTHDPNCAGTFAFFGPSQFQTLWHSLIHPSGNLIIVGEAASPHHAWVVGALESAVYGVYSWLNLRKNDIAGAGAALDVLENTKNPVQGVPFVGLPDYMDANAAAWAALFGNLKEERFFEGRGRR